MLEQQNYLVELATNGQQALEKLSEHSIDIVLLDVMMPIMDGFETAPLIKQQAGDVYLPIIFITALEDHQSFEKCFLKGKCIGRNLFDAFIAFGMGVHIIWMS